jgi:hypothetical protein
MVPYHEHCPEVFIQVLFLAAMVHTMVRGGAQLFFNEGIELSNSFGMYPELIK